MSVIHKDDRHWSQYPTSTQNPRSIIFKQRATKKEIEKMIKEEQDTILRAGHLCTLRTQHIFGTIHEFWFVANSLSEEEEKELYGV